jgi:uncharacterized membrane protein YhaH (DUF805 family)
MEEHATKIQHRHHGSIPLVLVLVGIVLLLANFNVLTPRVIDTLIRLWPLVLIYLGIDIMTRSNHRIRSIATVILLAATVFLVLFLSEQQIPFIK